MLALGASACATKRPVVPPTELTAQGVERRVKLREELIEKSAPLLMRAAFGPKADHTVDVLVLSGGGDYGAFGAAVLRSWKAIEGPDAMPEFDVVTGVSTGALIAPFAYLGTMADLEACERLYRNPKPDWVRTRGILALLPDNASLAEVPGLERELRSAVDRNFAERMSAEGAKGRMLVVNATDLDQGRAQAFELASEAKRAVENDDIERLHRIMLASAGIPGVFPPREIDGTLYADGGVTSNILYGAPVRYEDSLVHRFRQAFPAAGPLRVRYWVIFNNQAVSPARTVQRTWLDVLGRSVEVAIRASTMTGLRHLYSHADAVTRRGDGSIEVRWIAIPDDWRPKVEGVFKRETMSELADIGARLGADPANWKTTAPEL
ncbi:MAG: patatin-like phospholipase family protein [Planctomycetaceae bacterium]|nr:patatin-like phospholipase family protein [Planctomycetaceae bacterium]